MYCVHYHKPCNDDGLDDTTIDLFDIDAVEQSGAEV